MTRTPSSPDLTRLTLSVLVLGLLVVTCLWILQPFLGAIVWASMIVVATWPTMLALQARLGGRRWLAIAIMTLGMLFALVLPLALAVSAIVEHLGVVSGWVTTAMSGPVPGPPDWSASMWYAPIDWSRSGPAVMAAMLLLGLAALTTALFPRPIETGQAWTSIQA